METEIELGEYKGSATITIHELDSDGKRRPYPFSMGLKKARLVIKHIEDIEDFVANNETQSERNRRTR